MSDQLTFDDHEEDFRLRSIWSQVIEQVSVGVPQKMAERFIHTLVPHTFRNGTAVINVPSSFNAQWLRQRCVSEIQQFLSAALDEAVVVELRVVATNRKPVAEASPIRMATPVSERPNFEPLPNFRFDNYITGPSNRLAVAGAKAVALEPGSKFNPLFIYGPSGLGKTHLLHAIANELLRLDPNFPVAYLSAQQFTEEFVTALQTGKIDRFRRNQRNVGIWLLDDIQFIAGKDRTQEEVFYTFNSLQQTGRQIVLCSDRPPRELFLMDERLRSRFESGLVADIQAPDTETRCAIIRTKASQADVDLDMSVAMFLAKHVPGNIRVLEGALTKLIMHASVYESEISMDLAREIVDQNYSQVTGARPSLPQILDVVSRYYQIPIEDIRGSSRKAPIALARHVAVFIVREVTGDSWKHIGHQFGDRDHTSMMHAHQRISELISKDRDFGNCVKTLMRNVHPE